MKTILKGDRNYSCLREQNDLLYIGLPRSVSDGKQRHIPTGLKNTSENRIKASRIQAIVDSDIDRDDFDDTLDRYKPKHMRTLARDKFQEMDLSLKTLYREYSEIRKRSTSPSTHKSVYGSTLSKIEQCPHQDILQAQKIANWLSVKFTADSALRTLVQINACLKWALGVERIPPIKNTIPTIIKSLQGKPKKRKKIEYYSSEDRDTIVECAQEFSLIQNYPIYGDLIELLFLTGLRYSEAIALECKDWNGKNLTISKAAVEGLNGIELKQGLKREESRTVPVSPRAKLLLDRIIDDRSHLKSSVNALDGTTASLMFPSPKSKGYLDNPNYSNRFWKPLLEYINKGERKYENKIPEYTLYSARRTFISLALKSGVAVEDVAFLAGNSPFVIYQNYAGVTKEISVSDF